MYFTTYNIIHLLLSILCFTIFYVYGKKMENAKSDRRYWKMAFVPIVFYTLNFGLRYNRGTDYLVYESLYNNYIHGFAIESTEPVWNIILLVFGKVLQLPYQFLIMFMSFVFITGSVFFLRNHRAQMGVAMVMLLICSSLAENLARWFMAFGFLLIGLSYFEQKNIRKALIWMVVSFFTHYGFILCILPIVLLMLWNRKLLSPYIGVAILVASYFLFDLSRLGIIGEFLQVVDMGERYSNYQNNIDKWVSDDENNYGLPLTTMVKYVIFMLLSTRIKLKDSDDIGLYNVAIVGMSFAVVLHSLELTYRIGITFEWFLTILFPYMMWRFSNPKDNLVEKVKYGRFYKIILSLVLCSSIITYAKISLADPAECALYIWNK